MRPPTPSTSKVTPMRSGATSWTLRAKKLRLSNGLARVVADERREDQREGSAADDAENAARRDRDRQVRGVCERSSLEVADRRRGGDLHELDPGNAAEHLVRRDAIEHHGAQNRADLVAEAGETEQQQGDPELVRKGEGEDRGAPERCGDDHADALPPHVPERSG